ncbi:MAG TPA: hypothetical protein VKP59_04320 [Candidatus Thermoplasmatota archaeon]|nr:hypothetical protein [Candidatus Thermoplasmatota archaeon]
MNKKIIAMTSILILMLTTTSGTVVYAQEFSFQENHGLFASLFRNTGPSLDELIKTYEELKEAKQDLRQTMESYGIQFPDLTNEEKRELIQTIRELRRDGSSRREIREEIIDLLIDFGFNLPDLSEEQRDEIRTKIKIHLETNYGFVLIELTPEQKAYMKQTLIQLKRDGRTKEEIRDELVELYEGYGGMIPDLTEAEKEVIYDWAVAMIEQDYDVDLPDVTYEQRQIIKEKKGDIGNIQKDLRQQLRLANRLNRFRFFRYVKRDFSS